MSVRSREKIALAVFAALIVLSLLGLGWYLLAGHSWNVAASNIDDTFGSMEGYTAIVYEGTVVPKVAEDASRKKEKSASASQSARKPQLAPTDDSSSATTDDVQSATTDDAQSATTDDAQSAPASDAEHADAGEAQSATTADSQSTSDVAQESAKKLEKGASTLRIEPTVSIDQVQKSYEDKRATVFSLDTADSGQYSEGTILKKGSHRFGVFSVNELQSAYALKKKVAYFRQHKVDFIVAITSNKTYVDDVAGIDIVISTRDEKLFVMGETINKTFYVGAPKVGKVGTILISPSNVVSAKVIEEP